MTARVVVITGASAGIGRATAREFGGNGWRVGLVARNRERLEAAAEEVRRLGGEALVLPADVADPEQVEAAAARVGEAWGGIDVWVNNAMVTVYGPVERVTPDELRRVTDVSYHGAVWGTMAALRRMRPRDHGTVVQVGSALAYRSIPLQAAYCGAKSALRAFTDSLRSELIHERSRVRVTTVHLSAFNTPQFDWGRSHLPKRARPVAPVFQPELAAQAIYRAAIEYRREWWVGFPAAQAILGQRVLPGYLDRRLAHDAWEGQEADEPRPLDQPDNLFDSVPGDMAAHGRFNGEAQEESGYWELVVHRRLLAAAAGVAAATGLVAALSVRHRHRVHRSPAL